MKRSLLTIAAGSILLASAAMASAQTSSTTTTTTWTPNQGSMIREYSTTKQYQSFSNPELHPTIGTALPNDVTLYPLPDTVKVETPDQYSYTIINNEPVVVERSTRKVVHTWK